MADLEILPRWTALNWHVVQTKPRAEWMVHRNLRRLGFDTLYLHYPGTVKHARRVIGVIKPEFERYLFVGVEAHRWFGPDAMIGISSIVHGVDGPLRVPPEVMAELASRGDRNGKLPPKDRSRRRLEKGSRWQVRSDSPFEGFLAVVSADNGKTVTAWLDILGRQTPVEFEPEQLEPVSPRPFSRPHLRGRKRA